MVGATALSIVLAACGGDDDGDAAVPDSATSVTEPATVPDESAENAPASRDIAASLDEHTAKLRSAISFDGNPMIVDTAVSILTDIASEVDATRTALPDSTGAGASADGALDDLVVVLEEWSVDIEASLAGLDESRAEFEAALDEWQAGGPSGPPPAAYTDLLDLGLLPNERYTDACAALVLALEQSADCSISEGPGPDGGPPAATSFYDLRVTIGERDLAVGPVTAIEVFEPGELLGVDLDPETTLTVIEPPDVISPGTAPITSELAAPAPWPEDLAAWAETLPAEVGPIANRELGATRYDIIEIIGGTADPLVVIANDLHPEGGFAIAQGRIVRIYSGEIDGQPIVAVLQAFERPDLDLVIEQVDDIVATIRPAG